MKKVVLSMALVAMMSVSFVSCKDKAADAPAEGEATEVEATPATEEAAPAAADTAATAADTAATATPAAAPAATPAH